MVYIVLREGEVVFASEDLEEAENYADNSTLEARNQVLNDWGCDDPSEKRLLEAEWQAGYDGDYYEVASVDISGLSEDDTVTAPDGTEIDVSDILAALEAGDDEDDFDEEDYDFDDDDEDGELDEDEED